MVNAPEQRPARGPVEGLPVAPGTVRMPAAQRRQQLLDVAKDVLSRNGFYETTMAEIADSAGVTKPVLYQHFASKRELYTAILEDTGRRLRHAVIGSATEAASPRQQVEAGFSAYVRFVEDDAAGFRILFSGTSRTDSEWSDITRGVERSIAQGIAELIDVPEFAPSHRQALAHGIIGLAEGMMRYWQAGPDCDLGAADLARQLTALAWGGLRGLEP